MVAMSVANLGLAMGPTTAAQSAEMKAPQLVAQMVSLMGNRMAGLSVMMLVELLVAWMVDLLAVDLDET